MATVSCPDFIGRVEESRVLDKALAQATGGAAATVFVGGEAGIGKSRLVAEFSRRAGERQARVLTGGCAPIGGAALPFGPVVEALRTHIAAATDDERAALVETAPALTRLVPELAGEGATWERLEGFESGQSWVFALLLGALEHIAAHGPLVVVLEDLHWADRSTLDLLALRVQTTRVPGCAIVATYRSDDVRPGHPLRLALAELDRTDRTERVELRRFMRADLVAQMTGILGAPPEHDLVEDVLHRSDGNPFLAEELLAARDEPGAPTKVRDIVLARVETLPDDTQALLRVLSVARRVLAHHALAVASGMPEQDLERCLREALAHNILVRADGGAYDFRHALMREAIYDSLLVSEQQRLHGELARELETESASPQRLADLAHHWYNAGDRPRALMAAVQAGLAVDEIYAHAEALTAYERALELWDLVDDPERLAGIDRVTLLARAAEAASSAGDPTRASALVEQALADLDPAAEPFRTGLLRERLGRYLWTGGRPADSLAAYEAAVAAIPESPPSRERARTIAALSHAQLVSERHDLAAQSAAQSLEIARAVGAAIEEGASLSTLGGATTALGDVDEGLALVREARATLERAGAPPDFIFMTYSNEASGLIDGARHEEAADVARRGVEFMRRHGMVRNHQSWQEVLLALALVKLGRLREAAATIDEALLRGPAGLTRRSVQLLRAHIALTRGDLEAAEAAVADARGASEGHNPFGPLMFTTTAGLALARRELDAARAQVEEGVAIVAGLDDVSGRAWLYWRGLEVEAARADDARARRQPVDLAAAEPLLAGIRELAARPDAPQFAELPAALASCEAELERAAARPTADRWHAAAERWEELREPHPRATCLLRAAEAGLTERRPRADVAAALNTAHRLATDMEAEPLIGAIESLARRGRIVLGEEPAAAPAEPSPAAQLGLTPREIEVLRLIAEGYTNGEIAQTLFISTKTAGTHVSNILAKLDVARRVEAAAIAERLDLLAR
jgi:DNA-binding NarL/FixJ family response regulator